MDDDRPLSPELTAFLDDGEPPVYFGFGSMAEPMATGAAMVDAARAVGAVVVPHRYDQHYFAERVVTLGIGTTGELADALARALDPAVAAAARAFEVRADGAEVAARYVSG